MDKLLRAVTANGAIRAFVIDTKDIAERARTIHDTTAVVTAALGRTLSAASIMGIMLKGEKDTVSLQIKGDGPIGGIVAVADSRGYVRGYVHNHQVELPLKANGKLDVGGAIGKGNLTVIRDFGLKEPYIGNVALQTGEIAEDLTYYFALSEQTPSMVALGVLVERDWSVKASGGFVIQLMPEATESDIQKIEKVIANIEPISTMLDKGMSCEDILGIILKDFEYHITDQTEPRYECNCSRERIERALISIGANEIKAIIEEQGEIEMTCHFCDVQYKITQNELLELMSIAKK